MMYRRLLVVSAAMAGLTVAACRSEAPEPPAPAEPVEEEATGPDLDSLRAWEDSVRAAEEAERAAAAAREAAIADALAILQERVHFDFDRSEIRPDAEQALRRKLPILRASPQVRLRLEGHTDERGSVEYNQALGSRRAQSVADFLAQEGIPAGRLQTTSYGEEQPLVNASNENAWSQNRRVEFEILAGQNQINPPSD